jgi:hypothetical protein
VEAFRADVDQKLLLQDLAKNDIELYVKDKLLEDKRFFESYVSKTTDTYA